MLVAFGSVNAWARDVALFTSMRQHAKRQNCRIAHKHTQRSTHLQRTSQKSPHKRRTHEATGCAKHHCSHLLYTLCCCLRANDTSVYMHFVHTYLSPFSHFTHLAAPVFAPLFVFQVCTKEYIFSHGRPYCRVRVGYEYQKRVYTLT